MSIYCVSKSSDPFYVVTYNMKWVTTFWTYSNKAYLNTGSFRDGAGDRVLDEEDIKGGQKHSKGENLKKLDYSYKGCKKTSF